MNLPFFVARRYLFSKKSHNAINIISLISVIGVAVATMAMVCVLSVFNGFGSIVESMFSAFDPDLKITTKEGKVFDYHTPEFDRIMALPEIDLISEALEENALLVYEDRQMPVLVKGVSEDFKYLANMEKLIIDGSFRLREDPVDYITLGAGLAVTLGVRAGFVQPIFIFAHYTLILLEIGEYFEQFELFYSHAFCFIQPRFYQFCQRPIYFFSFVFGKSNRIKNNVI